MGRQINFFINNQDLHALVRFAEEKGFNALPEIIETDTVPTAELPSQIHKNARFNKKFFYLMPSEFAPVEAFYHELKTDPNRSKLMGDASPVIEVSSMAFEHEKPPIYRIFFCDDPSDPRYDRGLKGYNKLARFIRKWPKTSDGKFYVGPHTAEEWKAGRITLSYGGKELEIG